MTTGRLFQPEWEVEAFLVRKKIGRVQVGRSGFQGLKVAAVRGEQFERRGQAFSLAGLVDSPAALPD
ncbi:MAG TPA: hypothetical protein VH186_35560 [Chloroflexia bacterium]|nr:hypothetical protein [Chloroflexia bacterium]